MLASRLATEPAVSLFIAHCFKLARHRLQLVHEGTTRLAGVMIQAGMTIVCGVALSLAYEWRLALAVLATCPLLFFANKTRNRVYFSSNAASQAKMEEGARLVRC